jgi:hypothetical protein
MTSTSTLANRRSAEMSVREHSKYARGCSQSRAVETALRAGLSQTVGPLLRARSLQPEKRLMLVILLDAVEALIEGRRNGVEQWFAADDRVWPFSFVNICATLGIDAGTFSAFVARRLAERGSDSDSSRR